MLRYQSGNRPIEVHRKVSPCCLRGSDARAPRTQGGFGKPLLVHVKTCLRVESPETFDWWDFGPFAPSQQQAFCPTIRRVGLDSCRVQ
jgi:hypothetical protein